MLRRFFAQVGSSWRSWAASCRQDVAASCIMLPSSLKIPQVGVKMRRIWVKMALSWTTWCRDCAQRCILASLWEQGWLRSLAHMSNLKRSGRYVKMENPPLLLIDFWTLGTYFCYLFGTFLASYGASWRNISPSWHHIRAAWRLNG